MLHGVLPLSDALVTIGFSDLLRYICNANHEIIGFSIVAVASSGTHCALNGALHLYA